MGYFFVEGLETDITIAVLLSMNGRRDGIGIRKLERRPYSYRTRSLGKGHIDRDRLDAEPREHRVHRSRAGATRRAQRTDQYFCVVHSRDDPLSVRSEGSSHSIHGCGVMGVVPAQKSDQDVSIEDDYDHSRRSSSRYPGG